MFVCRHYTICGYLAAFYIVLLCGVPLCALAQLGCPSDIKCPIVNSNPEDQPVVPFTINVTNVPGVACMIDLVLPPVHHHYKIEIGPQLSNREVMLISVVFYSSNFTKHSRMS
jgi:hypothetical protein